MSSRRGKIGHRGPEWTATEDRPIAGPAGRASRRLALSATLALALAGVLPPMAFVALPQALALILPLPAGISLVAALVLAPAVVGVAAALLGLEQVRDRFETRDDKEHVLAVWRILFATAMLAYALGLAMRDANVGRATSCLPIAILASVFAWSLLLYVIVRPAGSAVRRIGAVIVDAVLLSAFLHFGEGQAAAWYPVYFMAIFYAGFGLGRGALVAASAASLLGFTAVVATTPVWQLQPELVAGLVFALAAMPAAAAMAVRAVARSRAETATARAARQKFLTLIGRGLRGPLCAMMRTIPDAEPTVPQAFPAVALPARAVLSQISEVLDLAAIESGELAPQTEPFDLHAIVNDTLAPLRDAAARHGMNLAVRLDPDLPYRLCGWPHQLAQILNSLVIAAITASESGTVRLEVDAAGAARDMVLLRLNIRGRGGAPACADIADEATGADAFGLSVATRLIELMGGRIASSTGSGQGTGWIVVLPLAVDYGAPPPLDLEQRPVLLVTEDSQFAGEVAELLNAWNADTRWVGGLDDALIYAERFETSLNPILIVDGRDRILPPLSFVHRVALARDEPPLILFVADAEHIAGLAGLDDRELCGLLPAPLDDRLLENALHALPLGQRMPPKARRTQHPAEVGAAGTGGRTDDRVTPIAAHPRFVLEAAAVVDARIVTGLRALGGGRDFLRDVIDSFRADASELMERIGAAAGAADAGGFARGVHALRRCAATLGGARLCEFLLSLRDIAAPELREQGSAIMQRLAAELVRLEAALLEFLPQAGGMHG